MRTKYPDTHFIMLVLLLFVIGINAGRARAEDPLPLPVTHQHFNSVEGVLTQQADGTVGMSVYKQPSSPICQTSSSDFNVNTDCEGNNWPHNETSIAVNPTNPDNIVGSANDYQLRLSAGGSVNEVQLSRAHVTFDGGQTWTNYPIRYKGYVATGDPAVSFDANGTAYLATMGFLWSQGYGLGTNADILVAHSSDGGVTWSAPSRVAAGSGSWQSAGVYNDKEFITAWGDGNAIVTWTEFNSGIRGSYISSPILASVTHDGGKSWSTPTPISGSASFCIGAQGGNDCNQSQGSTPVVAADGSIYVAFLSTENMTNYRDQYLVVRVDPNTGARIGGPYKVASVIDGTRDYPRNINNRQTYQDSQFRTWAVGNIAADPTDPTHLAVIWSDMRNSTLPARRSPYAGTTNSDIIVSQSFDGGHTWSAPTALAASGDQFMPWGVYDTSGILRIGYFDRSYDPANHKYGYTLATEASPGSLTFLERSQLTTVLSDPTQGTRWFSGGTPDSATTFLGDYSGIAASPVGSVAVFWTDLRVKTTFGTLTGTSEDAVFVSAP